ncbi:MAG: 16S rRNA (guanine(527)-N(7))-methyltransferase RsmG [Nitrospiraceae bacterium]|nr:16S rRNA (guanine(527)-N(7))-methyltransferase RsmG [Nitrospiraceae bacterium]
MKTEGRQKTLPAPGGLLKEGLSLLGIGYEGGAIGAFMTYLAELRKWNRAYNLTSITEDRDIVTKHFLDSALYLKAIEGKGHTIADVGSGAGFPGIPLKILRPDLSISLIEPSGKKAAFLRHMIRTLGLRDISAVEKRVEDMRDSLFDIALTRALFKAPEFVKKASGIVKKNGLFILSKGPAYGQELAGTPHVAMRFVLPFTDIERYIIVLNNG